MLKTIDKPNQLSIETAVADHHCMGASSSNSTVLVTLQLSKREFGTLYSIGSHGRRSSDPLAPSWPSAAAASHQGNPARGGREEGRDREGGEGGRETIINFILHCCLASPC